MFTLPAAPYVCAICSLQKSNMSWTVQVAACFCSQWCVQSYSPCACPQSSCLHDTARHLMVLHSAQACGHIQVSANVILAILKDLDICRHLDVSTSLCTVRCRAVSCGHAVCGPARYRMLYEWAQLHYVLLCGSLNYSTRLCVCICEFVWIWITWLYTVPDRIRCHFFLPSYHVTLVS